MHVIGTRLHGLERKRTNHVRIQAEFSNPTINQSVRTRVVFCRDICGVIVSWTCAKQ